MKHFMLTVTVDLAPSPPGALNKTPAHRQACSWTILLCSPQRGMVRGKTNRTRHGVGDSASAWFASPRHGPTNICRSSMPAHQSGACSSLLQWCSGSSWGPNSLHGSGHSLPHPGSTKTTMMWVTRADSHHSHCPAWAQAIQLLQVNLDVC